MAEQNDLPPIEIVEDEESAAGSRRSAEESAGTPDPAELGMLLPEEPQEAVDLLLRELKEARNSADSYLDDLRRVAADFENYRRRVQREQQQVIERATERMIRELLPVLDSFDAALSIEPQTETEEKLLGGMRGTYNQLMDVLGREGVEVIPTWNEPFDPEVHEAVASPAGGEGRLVVSQELRRGYLHRGRVLRAALVALDYEQGEGGPDRE